MHSRIGRYQQQASGYKAYIPESFPPLPPVIFNSKTEIKHAHAMRLIGKLDGITQLLPDREFFLKMFVRKEAASSSQIEGTQATMVHAIESEVGSSSNLPSDVDDILDYIRALNFALDRFQSIPLSIRMIREMHGELMRGARSTHNPFPGEIRTTQNWIGGTSPSHARFIPPPPYDISRALGELEKFIHSKDDGYSPLIKAALLHAQFETIHPFVDGNGRTGRLLVTLFIWQEKLLEMPLLYLSDFFKKQQRIYYQYLDGYHADPLGIENWVDFFLDGVVETATSAIDLAYQINLLREKDMAKLHRLGKSSAITSLQILRKLYAQPIVNVLKVQEWMGFTRTGAQKAIDRLIDLDILSSRNLEQRYGKIFEYRDYISIFQRE